MSEKRKKYHDRELNWLSFNARVLQEAGNKEVPLIERLKFLGIFSNNLDEFFRVRVATLKRLVKFEKRSKIPDEFGPTSILKKIYAKVVTLQMEFDKIYHKIIKELEAKNIYILNEKKVNKTQKTFISEFFSEHVQPLLVPIILTDSSPTPVLRDKSIYLFVKLIRKDAKQHLYSLIEIPSQTISRFVVLPEENHKKSIIYLDDVIRLNLNTIFKFFEPDGFESFIIKVTRDAELTLEGDLSDSYFELLERSLQKRKKADPVRFIYDVAMPAADLGFLLKKLKITEFENVIAGGRYHNFKDFLKFPNLGDASMEYPRIKRITEPKFENTTSILKAVEQQDHLLFFPFQPFDYVISFLRDAAIDPSVIGIKITLYRLASDSMIINALINAARNGKAVVAILELQARFDEEANLEWSKDLTDAGVRVVFGVPGLKIHAKLISITRKIKNRIFRYSLIGTGNFNETTSKLYTDISLITSDPELTEEVERVFSLIDKPYLLYRFKHLLVAPVGMRKVIMKLIRNETVNAKNGKKAYIKLKLNNLVDVKMIDALYEASNEGVKIELYIRGICTLIPGIKNLSENITATGIIDRFLEHSRIFVFCNNNKPLYYLSSADWMTRNLDYRIEVACPIYSPKLQTEINQYLKIIHLDNQKARIHNEAMDNTLVRNSRQAIRSQIEFFNYLKQRPEAIEIP
ncbi:MAG: polyphosphate kinase 1 [Flavobacteriales bacterium]|nr:polyphosphate kinase 1 [Flavobacteriales bacterium]